MDLQETLEEKRVEFKEVSTRVNVMLKDAPRMLTSAYEQLQETEQKYAKRAEALGIAFNLHVPKDDIDKNLEQIERNIEALKQRVEAMIGISFSTPEEAIQAASEMQGYGTKASVAKKHQNTLFHQIGKYQEEASFSEQKGVDEKVQAIINKIKKQLIEIRIEDLKASRLSWFSRVMGAGRLRDIQLENLMLEKDILDNTPIQEKTSYKVQDSLADLRAFSISQLDNQDTNDIRLLMGACEEVFEIPEGVIDEKARVKLNSVPMVMREPRKRVRTSEKIAKAEQRKTNLQTELTIVKARNSQRAQADEARKIANDRAQDKEKGIAESAREFCNILEQTANETSLNPVSDEPIKAVETPVIQNVPIQQTKRTDGIEHDVK